MDSANLFGSDSLLWILWLTSMAALAIAMFAAVRRRGSDWYRQLARDETGSAYSLSYVMTFPFYLLLICLAIESSLLITAKLGSVYAAYAAARSAAVWESARPAGMSEQKARWAAAQAMTPFASGSSQHRPPAGDAPPAARTSAFLAEYQALSGDDAYAINYLRRKHHYAHAATRVTIESPNPSGEWQVTAIVDYDAPLHIPGLGRLLGRRSASGNYFVVPITSQATLASETPQNRQRDIGIDYRSQ